MNFSMLVRFFILIIFAFWAPKSEGSNEKAPLCQVLKRPNSLLFDRFFKIKLQRMCTAKNKKHMLFITGEPGTACWYEVPELWAKSINYTKMAHTGIMLRTHAATSCPVLSYLDYQDLTFHSRKKIDGTVWKTKQANRFGRMLRKRALKAPINSPTTIEASQTYLLRYLKFGNTHIPFIVKREQQPSE